MSMRPDILKEVTDRLTSEFKLVKDGAYLRRGICPKCSDKNVWTSAESPWVVKCNRPDACKWEKSVKDLYPEIFDSWSNRYQQTHAEPNAAADAYLTQRRKLSLKGMKGAYTQETYVDRKLKASTATVRFPIPRTNAWWERLIDQPSRFGKKKANFAYGETYKGWVWHAPDQPYEVLATADEIWLPEGIFDAWALREAGLAAVSPLSCNNYPENFLTELRRICGNMGVKTPRLVFAYDIGKAGTEGIIKHVARAQKDGWQATGALPCDADETVKVDWNDLHENGLLTGTDPVTKAPWLDTYRWYGKLLLSRSATDKALLLWQRNKASSFHFVHANRTFWARYDNEEIQQIAKSSDVKETDVASKLGSVSEIASCAFRILYSLKDPGNPGLLYYMAIDTPDSYETEKAIIPPSALASGSKFKECLLGAATGAQWLGSTQQLDKIVGHQKKAGIKTVTTLDYLGYSLEHEAWVLGDIAVHKGHVILPNDHDYFDIGKSQLKLRTHERPLTIKYDHDQFERSWFPHFWTAWRGKGIVTLTFWVMSFFAQQLRAHYGDLGFLEMHGDHGTGKSTIILFLWKLSGLAQRNYEGIDPSKSTLAGYIRAITKYSNLPAIFVEGDRSESDPHVKKYDWDETKPLFMGQTGRVTGRKSVGTETYDALFRGALFVEQNRPINAEPSVLSRFTQTFWDKSGWNEATKAATNKIKAWDFDSLSGCMIHFIRREAEYFETFHAAYERWEPHVGQIGVRDDRVRTNHAKIHAGLDALAKVMGTNPLTDAPYVNAAILKEAHTYIDQIALERDNTMTEDHKVVAEFWDKFEYLIQNGVELDHSKNFNVHSICLYEFEAAMKRAGLNGPDATELKKHLKTSKTRPFIAAKTVDSRLRDNGTKHCWVFKTRKAASSQH